MQQQQQQALQMEYAKSKPSTVPTPTANPVKRQAPTQAPQNVLPSSIAQLVASIGGAQGTPK
jgi:hypothetical protein